MGKIIEDLFYAKADGEDFNQLDDFISEECSKRLMGFKEKLSPADYEKIRDVAFTASFISKRAAFGIGFKTAVNLILECRDSK